MKVMTLNKTAQYAWAAGFFDGEGHIGFSLHERQNGVSYPAIRMSITQWYTTTSLQTFRDIFGVGHVEQNLYRNENAWRYRLQTYSDIEFVMSSMYDCLSERKQGDWLDAKEARVTYLEAKHVQAQTCRKGHDQSTNGFNNSQGRHQCRLCTREYSRTYRLRKKNEIS